MGGEGSSTPRTARDLFWLVLGAVVGFVGHVALQSLDATTKRNDIIIKRRMDVYDRISPEIDDIYIYIRQVGYYKDITPVDILKIKRDIDKTVYSNIPYLSANFFAKYNSFMNIAFCTYNGVGEDAKIRQRYDNYKESSEYIHKTWEPAWEKRFSGEKPKPEAEEVIQNSFYDLLTTLANEIAANEITISFPISTGGASAKLVKIELCPPVAVNPN
jgi:hypothetical protein